jgi:hypothetical protein
MPKRTNSPNRFQTTVKGNFVYHWYMLFGQRQYDQFFLHDVRWQKFLNHPDTRSFSFTGAGGNLVTFRRETRRGGQFWYAYKKIAGRLFKVYAGRSADLDHAALRAAVAALLAKASGGGGGDDDLMT